MDFTKGELRVEPKWDPNLRKTIQTWKNRELK